jgi:DNA-binding PadR family transcriptional regulator
MSILIMSLRSMTTTSARPSGTPLPELKPVELLILVELLGQDVHGYGLVTAVEQSTAGVVRLVPGNLYRVLHRLIGRGLIEESFERHPPDDTDARRRYYRITIAGRRAAQSNVESLEALAVLGRNALESRRRNA